MSKFLYSAFVAIALVFLAYFIQFAVILDGEISKDTGNWADLGSYFGGVLGPILSFLALVLLIESLKIQNAANEKLNDQLINSEKTEYLKSFESLFFHMIKAQKEKFDSFSIETLDGRFLKGVDAFIYIELVIEEIEEQGLGEDEIKSFLEIMDEKGQIYSLIRSFYIIVKLITERLSGEQFDSDDRLTHMETLVNFTDLSQIILIIMSVNFLENYPSEYLKNNADFKSVMQRVGLKFEIF